MILGWHAAARAEDVVTFVDDPAILAALEGKGYGFAGPVRHFEATGDLATLSAKSPAYKKIVDMVGADVAALRAEMKAGGRPLYEVTDGNVGRVIDMRWFTTEAARFRLAGVVNRLDRKDFAEIGGDKGCGEVRFIYRLAYAFKKKGKLLASRLPVDFNAVYSVAPDADGGCTGVAGRWQPQLDEAVDAGWLAGGPIDPSELTFKQLELNAQVVRFPSGQETEFGGQAAYLMRIFGIDGDTVTEKGLENTPDTARLAADAALKERLVDYVRANAAAIDLGVYEVPDEFLARKVISWSTFGSVRRANHPFTETLSPDAFRRSRLRADAARQVAASADRAARQRHLPGLPPGRVDGGLPFHRPRRQDDVAAEPHRGRRLAAFPRRAAAARRLAARRSSRIARRQNSGRCPSRRLPTGTPTQPQYEPAGAAMPCMTAEDAAGLCRQLGVRGGHRLHADRQRHRDVA